MAVISDDLTLLDCRSAGPLGEVLRLGRAVDAMALEGEAPRCDDLMVSPLPHRPVGAGAHLEGEPERGFAGVGGSAEPVGTEAVRVLVVTNDLPPRVGGIQYYVDQLCRGLSDAGDDVSSTGPSRQGGGNTMRTPRTTSSGSRHADAAARPAQVRRHLLELVGEIRADVVVFGAAFPLGLLAGRSGRPVCRRWPSPTDSRSLRSGHRAAARASRIGDSLAAVTYVSHWCRDLAGVRAFGAAPGARDAPAGGRSRRVQRAVTVRRCGVDTASGRRHWWCACRGWWSARARTG